MNCALHLYMCVYSTPWKLYFFSRNINLTSRRLDFRTALTFFEYLVLIKITLGVHLLLGIDSVIKNLFKVLNTYKKRSVRLRSNSKSYKEFNLLHILLFSIFRWASWPTNSARLASAWHAQKWEGRGREKSAKNGWRINVCSMLNSLWPLTLLCLSCSSVSLSVLGLWLSLLEIQICFVIHFRFN